jgi:hypothetical protein
MACLFSKVNAPRPCGQNIPALQSECTRFTVSMYPPYREHVLTIQPCGTGLHFAGSRLTRKVHAPYMAPSPCSGKQRLGSLLSGTLQEMKNISVPKQVRLVVRHETEWSAVSTPLRCASWLTTSILELVDELVQSC